MKNKPNPPTLKKKAAAMALTAALALTLLGWFQISYPFFYPTKFAKILMYAIALFLPVMIETLLGLGGVKVPEIAFYTLSLAAYGVLFYWLFSRYLGKPEAKRTRYALKATAGAVAYIAAAMYYLW